MSADKDEEINRMRERMHGLNDVVQATVLRHATIASDVTHLVEGFKEHREDSKAFMSDTAEELRAIREQTTKTNGRVSTLEGEVRDLKLEREPHLTRHDAKRNSDRPDVITINIPAGVISAKAVTTIVAGVLAGLVAAWKAGLFQ